MTIFKILSAIFFGFMLIFAYIVAFLRILYSYSIGFIWGTSKELHDDFLRWAVKHMKR